MIHTRYGGSGLGLFICRSECLLPRDGWLGMKLTDRNHRVARRSNRGPLRARTRVDIPILRQGLGRSAKISPGSIRRGHFVKSHIRSQWQGTSTLY